MSTTVETNSSLPPASLTRPSHTRMRAAGRAVGSILMSVLGMVVGFTVMGKLLHHNPTRPSAPSTWATVALDNNSSVSLPPAASHEAQVMPVGNGSLTVDTWTAHSGSYDYSVARTPIAQSAVDGNRVAVLRGAASGVFTSAHIDTPMLTDTKVAGIPAVRGVGQTNGVTVHGAFLYTHGALYEMLVAGPHALPSDLDTLIAGFSTRG